MKTSNRSGTRPEPGSKGHQSAGICGRSWRCPATPTHSRNRGCQRSSLTDSILARKNRLGPRMDANQRELRRTNMRVIIRVNSRAYAAISSCLWFSISRGDADRHAGVLENVLDIGHSGQLTMAAHPDVHHLAPMLGVIDDDIARPARSGFTVEAGLGRDTSRPAFGAGPGGAPRLPPTRATGDASAVRSQIRFWHGKTVWGREWTRINANEGEPTCGSLFALIRVH